jgi:hypothetical protein
MRDLISIVALLALLRGPAAIASHGTARLSAGPANPTAPLSVTQQTRSPARQLIFAAAAEGTGSSHDV